MSPQLQSGFIYAMVILRHRMETNYKWKFRLDSRNLASWLAPLPWGSIKPQPVHYINISTVVHFWLFKCTISSMVLASTHDHNNNKCVISMKSTKTRFSPSGNFTLEKEEGGGAWDLEGFPCFKNGPWRASSGWKQILGEFCTSLVYESDWGSTEIWLRDVWKN